MNQLALREPSTRLKPVTGDPKLKAVRGMCYLCRRLSSIASQVENQIREPSELALAGFQDVALRWRSAPRSDYIMWPSSHPPHSGSLRGHSPITVLQRTLLCEIQSRTTGREIPNCNNRHASPLGEWRVRHEKLCTNNIQVHMFVLKSYSNGWNQDRTGWPAQKAGRGTVYGDIMKKCPEPGTIVLSDWGAILWADQANLKQPTTDNLRQMLLWRKKMDPKSCTCSQLG